MTALVLALLVSQAVADPAPTCPVQSDPTPSLQLTLTWGSQSSKGLWLSEDQAIRNANRMATAEEAAQRAAVPWWIWVVGSAVVFGFVGFEAHTVIGGK